MLKIWGRTTSSNVQKVLWTCAELGITYDRVDHGGPFGSFPFTYNVKRFGQQLVERIAQDPFERELSDRLAFDRHSGAAA